ncbi:MAG: LD-carboxypeptidase [Bacteroidales bacterium]
MKENLRQPQLLMTGDKIGIISTARKISAEELLPAEKIFDRWGLQIVKGKYLHAQWNQFAGTDEQRRKDLQEMLDNPQIKAIICARGGYGTARIIDNIDFSRFNKNPKWVVGYSDITALHSHIHTHFNIETLHAAMPLNFPKSGRDNDSTKSLKKALFEGRLEYSLPKVEIFNDTGFTQISGILTGGNLSMLYSLTGSPSDIDSSGKLLFIEDLDEYLYHVDRMILNLKRSKKLSRIKALLVGWMNDMNDNPVSFGRQAHQIIKDHTKGLDFPVIFGIPAGHLEPNLALIFGRKIFIERKNGVSLKM